MRRMVEKIARGAALLFLIIGVFISRPQVMGIDSPIYSYIEFFLPSPALENLDPVYDLFGLDDIIFQLEQEFRPIVIPGENERYLIERLRDFDYLRTQFFVSDRNTGLLPSDIDVYSALQMDFTINTREPGPRVLVFHTHSTEMFADSDPSNPMDGVMGLGARLVEILEQHHGISALHDTTRFDIVDGRTQIQGAYERMEPHIQQVLSNNPTIEVVIDLHRDGLPEGMPPLISYIDGQRVARIMFVNGLSRRRSSSGVLEPVPWLPNPYLRENLAFSFQLQMAANRLHPGFTRRLYLKAFRYSLHMLPRSMLVEVGAQNNTMEEARNAIPYLAAVIAEVILSE